MSKLLFIFMAVIKCAIIILTLFVGVNVQAEWYTVNGQLQLPGPVRIFEDIYKNYLGVDGKVATRTTAAKTYYVTATGSDTKDCLTSANACATVQSVLDRIPQFIEHTTIISVGAGTFVGFAIHLKVISGGSLTVQGTLGDPTLTTGTTTGSTTAGDTLTCTDAGQTWTANELRGKLVLVGSDYRVVRNNTAQTMNLVGALSATCNGKAYHIYEQKSVFTSAPSGWTAIINVQRNMGGSTNTNITDVKTTGGYWGVYFGYTAGGTLTRAYISGAASMGVLFQSVFTEFNLYECYSTSNSEGFRFYKNANGRDISRIYAYNNTGVGIYVFTMNSVWGAYWYADYNAGASGIYVTGCDMFLLEQDYTAYNTGDGIAIFGGYYIDLGTTYTDHNGGNGLFVAGTTFVDLDAGSYNNNTGWGIYVDIGISSTNARGNSFINAFAASISVADNTAGGIRGDNNSKFGLSTTTGTGNGTYGIDLRTGSSAIVTSATTVTGATGDFTINEGTNTLTYATHLASNGDKAINIDTTSRIERRD